MKITNLKRVMGFEAHVLEKRLKKGAKDDTGKLKSSIDVSFSVKNNTISMNLKIEEYSKWIDEGRKPGKGMPVKPLKEWIVRNKLTVKDVNGKTVRMTDSRLNGLSYIINRKIRKEGIKGNDFISNPVDLMMDTIAERLAKAFVIDIGVELRKI